MVEHINENHYDEDLTVDSNENDDSLDTSEVDLFEFSGTAGTPIAHLKTLILSLEWEITNEVLLQFNEEIVDLKDIWAQDQIKLVYLQALEKISKYIYKEKANVHPNAVKTLLSIFYNLEKQVNLADVLSDEEKKKQLVDDVRSFEKLKRQITQKPSARVIRPLSPTQQATVSANIQSTQPSLQGLKAAILALDWEITEKELSALREEVFKLEELFSDSQTKLLFLQGIGTLSAYIRNKKSNTHIEAFTLLQSFFAGLEHIVSRPLTPAEEKAILLPEVKKFTAFKEMIAVTLSPEALHKDEDEEKAEDESDQSGALTPALADLPEEKSGFQEEEEAASIGIQPASLSTDISRFFEEDDEDEEKAVVASAEQSATSRENSEAENLTSSFFDAAMTPMDNTAKLDPAVALQGVAVETEADDDSGEEALPMYKGGLAPALMDKKFEAYLEENEETAEQDAVPEELVDRLDVFFGTENSTEELLADVSQQAVPQPVSEDLALPGVDVESEDDEEDFDQPISSELFDIPAHASDTTDTISGETSELTPQAFSSEVDTPNSKNLDDTVIFSIEDELGPETDEILEIDESDILLSAKDNDNAFIEPDTSSFDADQDTVVPAELTQESQIVSETASNSQNNEDDFLNFLTLDNQESTANESPSLQQTEPAVAFDKRLDEPAVFADEQSASFDTLTALIGQLAAGQRFSQDTLTDELAQLQKSVKQPLPTLYLKYISTLFENLGSLPAGLEETALSLAENFIGSLKKTDVLPSADLEAFLSDTVSLLNWQQDVFHHFKQNISPTAFHNVNTDELSPIETLSDTALSPQTLAELRLELESLQNTLLFELNEVKKAVLKSSEDISRLLG